MKEVDRGTAVFYLSPNLGGARLESLVRLGSKVRGEVVNGGDVVGVRP
jgi:hypothetical protein